MSTSFGMLYSVRAERSPPGGRSRSTQNTPFDFASLTLRSGRTGVLSAMRKSHHPRHRRRASCSAPAPPLARTSRGRGLRHPYRGQRRRGHRIPRRQPVARGPGCNRCAARSITSTTRTATASSTRPATTRRRPISSCSAGGRLLLPFRRRRRGGWGLHLIKASCAECVQPVGAMHCAYCAPTAIC